MIAKLPQSLSWRFGIEKVDAKLLSAAQTIVRVVDATLMIFAI